jgi:glutaconyl-CoA decarboxylase
MKYKVTLNKKVYEVEVEKGEAILLDEYEAAAPVAPAAPVAAAVAAAAPVAATPASAVAPAGENAVTSPLPGSIFDIKVKVGDSVNVGDVLIIIEAMKMENEVVATDAGTVRSVDVTKGQTVETGTVLLTIE